MFVLGCKVHVHLLMAVSRTMFKDRSALISVHIPDNVHLLKQCIWRNNNLTSIPTKLIWDDGQAFGGRQPSAHTSH